MAEKGGFEPRDSPSLIRYPGAPGRRNPTTHRTGAAERVVREAGCPVLTTRMPTEPQWSTTSKAFNRILCPIDFEESSLKALDLAGRIAAQTGAELYLLHVCPTVMIPLGGRSLIGSWQKSRLIRDSMRSRRGISPTSAIRS